MRLPRMTTRRWILGISITTLACGLSSSPIAFMPIWILVGRTTRGTVAVWRDTATVGSQRTPHLFGPGTGGDCWDSPGPGHSPVVTNATNRSTGCGGLR